MPINLRAAQGSNNGSGGTTLTLTKPTGVAEGDVMVASVTVRGGTGTSITAPAGGGVAYAAPASGAPALLAVNADATYLYAITNSSSSLERFSLPDLGAVDDLALGTTGQVSAQSPAWGPDGHLWIPCIGAEHGIRVVRVSDMSQLADVPTEANTSDVVFSPDGQYAYASANTSPYYVYKIDVATRTVVASVTGVPFANLAVTPDGDYLYVCCRTDNVVRVLRTSDLGTETDVSVGTSPRMVAIDAAGSYAYVTNWSSANCSVIRLSDNTVVTTLSCSTNPTFPTVSPDGAYVLIANNGSQSYSVIRTSDNTALPVISVTGTTPRRFRFSPDGAYAYLSGTYYDEKLYVVRMSDRAIVATLTVASGNYNGVADIAVAPTGALYCAGNNSSTVYEADPGWLPLDRTDSGTTLGQGLYWKRAGSADGASYDFTITSAKASGVAITFSGADPFTPVGARYGGQANSSSSTITAPALTLGASRKGVEVVLSGIAYGTTIDPVTLTEPANGESGSSGGGANSRTTSEVEYAAYSGTGPASRTATAADNGVNIGHHVFLAEAPVDPPPARLLLSGAVPDVVAGGNQLALPSAAGLVLTGVTPLVVVAGPVLCLPDPASLVLTAGTPSVIVAEATAARVQVIVIV